MKKKYESDFTKINTSKKTIGNKIVKINKMKGGVDDYDFNETTVKNFFLEMCKYTNFKNNQVNFKVLYRKMHTLGLILFGVNLEIIKTSNYLPYIYYLFKDTVKFKRVSSDNMGRIVFTNITFEELSNIKLNGVPFTELLLESLSAPKKNNFSDIKNEQYWYLINKLKEKIIEYRAQMEQQMLQQMSPQSFQQIQQQISPQMNSPTIKNQLSTELQSLISKQEEILKKTYLTNQNKQNIKKITSDQQILKQKIQEELQKIQNNPQIKNFQKQIKENQLTTQLNKLTNNEKQLKSFKIKKGISNITDKLHYYICEEPTLEVNIKPDGNIFFGYNQNLILKTSDGVYKFYYKYSYRGGNFFQLKTTLDEKHEHEIKQDGQLVEVQIDINLIPTYDILCLYFAIKDKKERTELLKKLEERINKAKENISKTAEAFYKLDNSNFEKESRTQSITNATREQKEITNVRHKNFGKVKKRRVTEKTYIFFGTGVPSYIYSRNSSSKFNYVCFREDDKVFYYEILDLNKKKSLYNFPYIIPLEDLISFILLRRMITGDNNFADVILKEAQRTIKVLKTIKYTEKITINKNPENWQYSFSSVLVPTKKYSNERYEETQKLKQTSLLPRSQAAIRIFESF